MLPLDLYQGIESAWCPGCGNFGLLKSFKQALAELARSSRRRSPSSRVSASRGNSPTISSAT